MTKEEFLTGLDNMSNHRILLWEALKLTYGDVVEFGSGLGSTTFLRQFCKENKRFFFSFDNNPDWALLTGATVMDDWDTLNYHKLGLLFIDHAPGERRKVDLLKYKDVAQIIVIHDSEPKGWNSSDYQVRELFDQFKYRIEIKSFHQGGAWATMLSNSIDLEELIGVFSEGYFLQRNHA